MESAIMLTPATGALAQSSDRFDSSLFQRYIGYTDVKELTLKGYAVGIRAFGRWMKQTGVTIPTREDVKSYKQFLDASNFTAGTRASYLRIVKHFFKWTASEGLYPNIADNIKGAKVSQDNTKKDAFGEADIRTILAHIDRSSVVGKRDYAMILLCVTCALRIIEINRSNVDDIQMVRGQKVLYIQGKGHDEKDEYIKLVSDVGEAISEYLSTRPNAKKGEPLFTGTSNRAKGARLSEPSISTIIKTRFREAGYDLSKLTAHSLRHTGVTLLLKANGGNIQQAQRYARHRGMNTTLIYSHNIEREKDHSEQLVYDYIFHHDGSQTPTEEAIALIRALDPAKLQAALDYIRQLSKED